MLHVLRTIVTVLAGIVVLANTAAFAQPAETAQFQLEAKIPLGDVRGRIDHMAVDLKRQRLFVAELGNDSVGIVDLQNRRLIRKDFRTEGAPGRRLRAVDRHALYR
jgi:hypothetical protein